MNLLRKKRNRISFFLSYAGIFIAALILTSFAVRFFSSGRTESQMQKKYLEQAFDISYGYGMTLTVIYAAAIVAYFIIMSQRLNDIGVKKPVLISLLISIASVISERINFLAGVNLISLGVDFLTFLAVISLLFIPSKTGVVSTS